MQVVCKKRNFEYFFCKNVIFLEAFAKVEFVIKIGF